MMSRRTLSTSLLLLLVCQNWALAVYEDLETTQPADTTTPTTTTTSGILARALLRQARSEPYFRNSSPGSRYVADEVASASAGSITPRAAPVSSESIDKAYYEARCLTCKEPAVARQSDRDYNQGRWRQKYDDYYYDDLRERRYRDRYDGYERDRGRVPPYEYDRDRDRYEPYGRNELFKPTNYDRYEPYYNDRWVDGRRRPLIESEPERSIPERPLMDRPYYDSRSYDRASAYDRGNGYDNLDPRYRDMYEDRPASVARRPHQRPNEEYGVPYVRPEPDRGRYDPRYYNDRYDPRYESYDARYDTYDGRGDYRRRPYYDERYPGPRLPSSNYDGWSSPGGSRTNYASAWNYGGSARNNWKDLPSERERNRDRDRDRDRDVDSTYYRPRDYWYDSTAAPGASHDTSYITYKDRTESSTKPDADKPTSSPQNQENNNKNYKD